MSATLEAAAPRAEHDGRSSLPARLLQLADERPNAIALRTKELGRWREVSWAEHAARVETIGRGLLALGVGPGDRVGILADNRPEWLVTDLAAQGIGAATVGVFMTTTAPETAAMLSRAGVRVVIVEDEEQLDKVLEVHAKAGVERIVVIDTRGIRSLDDPAMSFEALEALGTSEAVAARSGDVAQWREAVTALAPDGVATIVFTPGTTGEPKGVLLTHANLAAAGAAAAQALGLRADDEIVSTLPLGEITERSLTMFQAMHAGCTVNFGEGGDSLPNDLREVQPTVFLGVPRLWEYLRQIVESGLRNAGRIKRNAVHAARARRRGPVASVLDALVTRPLRRQIGLGRVRVPLTATAPLAPDLVAWWRTVGVPLREAYGLVETAGPATATSPDDPRTDDVGRALPGVEVRVEPERADESGSGEVQVRGPSVFTEYLEDAAATSAARGSDGWLHTGDVGRLDDGILRIIGRSDDLFVTSAGARVAPRSLEQQLELSPYVRTAVVVGDGRPCAGVLVVIDGEAVGDWAATEDVPYTTYGSLTERPEVRELISECIDSVNAALDESERIGCFALLPSEPTQESGELTATFKLRRRPVMERNAALIDDMYRSGTGEAR